MWCILLYKLPPKKAISQITDIRKWSLYQNTEKMYKKTSKLYQKIRMKCTQTHKEFQNITLNIKLLS